MSRRPATRYWAYAAATGACVALVALTAVVDLRGAAGASAQSPTPAVVGTSAAVGRPAPALQATAIDGRRVDLATYTGRPVLVTFFGSWCDECKAEANMLSHVVRARAGRLAVVGVAVSDTAKADRAFAAEHGWTWPVVEDRDFRLAADFRVVGVPTAVLVDPHGRIVDVLPGAIPVDRLDHDLARLMA